MGFHVLQFILLCFGPFDIGTASCEVASTIIDWGALLLVTIKPLLSLHSWVILINASYRQDHMGHQ
jgi:hypothetical protein